MNDSFFTFNDFELTDFDSAFDSRDSNSFSLDVEGDSSSDINGTEGEDDIENIRDDVAINAKGGNDTVNNSGSQVVILGGYGARVDSGLYPRARTFTLGLNLTF